jgi:hypothetical protein
MIITPADKKWFDELTVELSMRDVFGVAIGDAVASAKELLVDTGQSAEEAFGPARAYAASLELPREPGKGGAKRGLGTNIVGMLAFFLFIQAAAAWTTGEQFLTSPLQLVLMVALGGLLALFPLYFIAAIRRPWLLVLLFVTGGGIGWLYSFATPATEAEALFSSTPLPWVIASAVIMVAMSIWGTIRTLRRGTMDDIPEPGTVTRSKAARGIAVFRMITHWLFPIFATLMLGLFLLIDSLSA